MLSSIRNYLKFLLLITCPLILISCDNTSSSGITIIGIETGSKTEYPIKEGPRDPPAFFQDLEEFYELNYVNPEFSFVGIARTINSDEGTKLGVLLEEGFIWALWLYNEADESTCSSQRKTKVTSAIKEKLQDSKNIYLNEVDYFYKDRVIAQYSCSEGFSGELLIVRDYGVLYQHSNNIGKEFIQKALDSMLNQFQRTL